MRILIVEDDQKLARQLRKGLEEQGHSAGLAFDGHAGLRAAQAEPFEVFVLDVMLPGIDGFETCRRLRAARASAVSVRPVLPEPPRWLRTHTTTDRHHERASPGSHNSTEHKKREHSAGPAAPAIRGRRRNRIALS